jgi:hypothetical protein
MVKLPPFCCRFRLHPDGCINEALIASLAHVHHHLAPAAGRRWAVDGLKFGTFAPRSGLSSSTDLFLQKPVIDPALIDWNPASLRACGRPRHLPYRRTHDSAGGFQR